MGPSVKFGIQKWKLKTEFWK